MKRSYLYLGIMSILSLLLVASSTHSVASSSLHGFPSSRLGNSVASPLGLPLATATVEVNILSYNAQNNLLSLHASYNYFNADGLLRDFDASSKQDVTNFTFSYEGSGTCELVTPVSIQCDENITRIIGTFNYTQTVTNSTVEVGAGINIPGASISGDVTMTYVEPLLYISSTLEPSTKQPGFLHWIGNADNAYGAYVTFEVCELIDGACPVKDICDKDTCLVAYYHFNHDSTSEAVAHDFSEFGNNGNLNGVTIECNSAYLDGNDYISIPHKDSLYLKNAFTIAAWVKPAPDISGYIPVLTKGNTSSLATPYSVGYHDLGSKIVGHARLASNTTTYSSDLTVNSLSKDLWNYVVWRFEDGVLQIFNVTTNGTTPIEERNIGFSTLANNKLPLEIGRDIPGATEFFRGHLDEIRIYNGALTTEEIGTIYSPMKLPYDQNNKVYWTGGPHGYNQGGNFTGTYPACEGTGIDFSNGNNFEVLAVASGEVIDASCDLSRAFGCQVAIKHDFDGSVAIYAHLYSISLPEPTSPYSIEQGQLIGYAGQTGTDDIHLHLELRDGSDVCDETTNCVSEGVGGNPMDWGHGPVVIDDYQIYGYQNINIPSQFFNYDGSAVISRTVKFEGFPYVDNGIERSTEVLAVISSEFECVSSIETNCEKNDLLRNLIQFASEKHEAIFNPNGSLFILGGEEPILGRLLSSNIKYIYSQYLPMVSKP